MTLKVAVTVPTTILANQTTVDATLLSDALWYRAEDAAPVWPNRHSGPPARAVEQGAYPPLQHHGHLGAPLMRDVHCGYSVEHASSDLTLWSAALLWSPPPDGGRSLLCRRPARSRSYVMLWHDADGALTLSQAKTEASVAVRRRTGPWRLDYIGASRDRLHLMGAGAPMPASSALMEPVRQPADLLIGCRLARAGKAHTLGGAVLGEVIFWPNRDITRPDGRKLRQALERAFEVEYGHDL